MTSLDAFSRVVYALRFSLDDYTDWYNSPRAALLFWSFFVAAVLVIVLLSLFFFRKVRH